MYMNIYISIDNTRCAGSTKMGDTITNEIGCRWIAEGLTIFIWNQNASRSKRLVEGLCGQFGWIGKGEYIRTDKQQQKSHTCTLPKKKKKKNTPNSKKQEQQH